MPLVCEACKKPVGISELAGVDAFTLFGLPIRYSLSRPELEKAYLKASKSLHPDYFRDRPDHQSAARRLAALANDSYALLKDALKRAQLLVRLWAGDKVATEKSLAPGFLEEQLALREKAEALQEDDVAREALRRTTLERLMAVEGEIAALMRQAEESEERLSFLLEVQRRLNELSYHRRLLRRLEKTEAEG
jgi:DnaJ-domain-containing protein 1